MVDAGLLKYSWPQSEASRGRGIHVSSNLLSLLWDSSFCYFGFSSFFWGGGLILFFSEVFGLVSGFLRGLIYEVIFFNFLWFLSFFLLFESAPLSLWSESAPLSIPFFRVFPFFGYGVFFFWWWGVFFYFYI